MSNSTSSVLTPTLKRRLICLVYEAFLLTAVLMLGMLLFVFATQKTSGALVEYGRELVLVLVAGAYFIHSWTGSGHTLAMKTWRIKLVKLGHAQVPFRAALLRYVFAWFWVMPALVVCWRFGLKKPGEVAAALAVGIVVWALTAFLDRDRQFLHDRIAGTRLISLPKPPKPEKLSKVKAP